MAKVSEAEQSVRDLDKEAAAKAKTRADDGRYVPRYPGIRCPRLDANFSRTDYVALLREKLTEGKWHSWKLVASRTGVTVPDAVHQFEQLGWFGLTRKTTLVEGRGGVDGVVVATPDGAWVVDAIRWSPREDA
jgi:hypothetical protein